MYLILFNEWYFSRNDLLIRDLSKNIPSKISIVLRFIRDKILTASIFIGFLNSRHGYNSSFNWMGTSWAHKPSKDPWESKAGDWCCCWKQEAGRRIRLSKSSLSPGHLQGNFQASSTDPNDLKKINPGMQDQWLYNPCKLIVICEHVVYRKRFKILDKPVGIWTWTVSKTQRRYVQWICFGGL